jgi:RNA-binding protein
MSKITPGKKRYIKRRLTREKPTIWIGKNGPTQELIKEIEKQLDKNKMIKVKILKSALPAHDAKQIATKTAQQTEATLIEVRGHTFTLYKHSKK